MKKYKKVGTVDIPGIDRVLGKLPLANKNYVTKSLEIVHQVFLLLKEKGMNQKSLAHKLGKSEPEISKWLSGTHNFTIRTITSIETILEKEILVAPYKVKSILKCLDTFGHSSGRSFVFKSPLYSKTISAVSLQQ